MNKTGLLCLATLIPGLALADSEQHYVYTLLNSSGANVVQTYVRKSNGALQFKSQTYTGGLGSGVSTGLGTQGSLSLTENGRFLLAVNAGDNTVSIFYRDGDKLTLTDVEPSGGVSPGSVAEHDGLVYVLNQGSATVPGNIQGFALFRGGLIQIPDATAALSALGVIPVEIKFTPNGNGLVVPEKTSNLIDTFQLDFRGLPVNTTFQSSHGVTPFGFDFDPSGRLFITEAFGGAANASAVSSYNVGKDLGLHLISGSIATNQSAACWDAVTPNGKWLYTGNAGSGTISGYKISNDGSISLLKSSGVSGTTGGHTQDLAVSTDGEYLYVLATVTNQITTFKIGNDGSLTKIDTQSDLPSSASGLVSY